MKQPYLMSRDEWNAVRESLKVQGSGIFKPNSTNICAEVKRISDLTFIHFGVQHWLHEKAIQGDEASLELLLFGYDVYEQLIFKAKEEGLIE
jgi:hypothetical protein